MATIQLQKAKNAGTVTKTAITQKQSLEVVQTMLHGGLSTLSYLRCFFADKAFEHQVYPIGDNIYSYEDYAGGKLPQNVKTKNDSSTKMQVLRRGRSRRVDMFLDWLEHGAFAALKAGNLKSLEIYVHADPQYRERVIETYTFNINYLSQRSDDGEPLAGIEMNGPGTAPVTVAATNGALQLLLRQVMKFCNPLPELPEKRYISMALFYVHDTAMNDRPQGFVPNNTPTLFFAEAEGWEKREEQVTDLGAGFHSAALNITYLKPVSYSWFPGVQVPTIPQDLQYNPLLAINDRAGKPVFDGSVETSGDEACAGPDDPTTTPSTVVDNVTASQEVQLVKELHEATYAAITPAPTSDQVPLATFRPGSQSDHSAAYDFPPSIPTQRLLSQVADSYNTQSSNIPEMKKALKAMMQPEHLTQGDTQTQALLPPPLSESASPTRTDVSSPTKDDKPLLSQSVTKRLDAVRTELREKARCLAKAEVTNRKKDDDLILCQCGYAEDEGDMVECVYCGTWQHLHCYGYIDNRDPRLLDDHACYQCLLGDDEPQTLENVKDLALKRRGMSLVLRNGLKTQRDFADEMGLTMSKAKPFYESLKTKGYVVAAPGSKKAGYASSRRVLYVAVKQGPNYEKMLAELFDPLTHISHHYELPAKLTTQPTLLTQQLMASRRGDMLPPTTPASRLKKAVSTPGSGLDLRASLTPFETPSRPRSRQSQPLKRPQDEQNAAMTPAKRLKSVHSKFMLDAGGLSSSPANSVHQ
ncbi:hypothetical protein LTR37_000853 [Vermiconidia calcicola]|uniref:Uncharacterized protein n=1 Tax=Vermiconidia calcicola TaxID=1690605 RepID=A0ACC3NY46_9PEZI|nr:hypothetical protein LTR37_000853 [Vermiconidia calcicola]